MNRRHLLKLLLLAPAAALFKPTRPEPTKPTEPPRPASVATKTTYYWIFCTTSAPYMKSVEISDTPFDTSHRSDQVQTILKTLPPRTSWYVEVGQNDIPTSVGCVARVLSWQYNSGWLKS